MTWQLAAAVLAGTGIGTGLWLLVSPAPATRAAQAGPWSRLRVLLSGRTGARVAAGVAAGLVVLLVTRWVPVAVAAAGAVIAWPVLFGAAAEQRATILRLEALAAWVEGLRDAIATSRGLPEALPAASARAHPALAGPLQELRARIEAREPIEVVLRRLADDLDDPIADQAVAALILNYRAQGRELKTALTTLAAATRREVEARRTVESDRRSTRRAVALIMTATVAVMIAMAVFVRDYAAPYATPTGQLVLALVVALLAAGFAVIRTLSRYTTPDRFLTGHHPSSHHPSSHHPNSHTGSRDGSGTAGAMSVRNATGGARW